MERYFLDWIRQANGLLLEAYRRQAQECRLCWRDGELRFQALITSSWELIKAVPLDSDQYLRLFNIATQMIDEGGHFQIRMPGKSDQAAAYRISFLTGNEADECAVRLILEPPNWPVSEESEAELNEGQLDTEYIN